MTSRIDAAFTLDQARVTRTKARGAERIARKLHEALPSGDRDLRAAVWELIRPILPPALVDLTREAFVIQDERETTVDLAARHAASSLDDLDLENRAARPRSPHRAGPSPPT